MKINSDKKQIISWALFDFANSPFTTLVVTFIYAAYFIKEIAGDEITGTQLWSFGVTITAIFVALLSPISGVLADICNLRKISLFISTLIAAICTSFLYFILPGNIYGALFFFIIANIAFETGMIFYNAFLPEIAPPDKIGKISGFGWGLGYIGGLAALFIALIGFIYPDVPWFSLSKEQGQNIRATNFLVAFWYILFSIPLFVFIKEQKAPKRIEFKDAIFKSMKELYNTFLEIKKYRKIFTFLLARLIYNDALITIFAFGGIYASGTFNFSYNEILIFGIVLNICAGTGAIVMGYLDDYIGGKKTIQFSIIALTIASCIAVFAPDKIYFWISGILVGIFSGPNQSASRSYMSRLIPKDRENQFFGFYAFSGKCTAFLGPFLLGILTEFFHCQRIGISVVILFFIVGFVILSKVDMKKQNI